MPCSRRSVARRISNISTCRPRSATATSISPKPRSRICGGQASRRRSRRSRTRSGTTSRGFSTARTAIGERDDDDVPSVRRGMMFDFEHRLVELGAQTVLCVGDLMLDEFVYGEVSRISPEAPAPVIAIARQETVIGGAGNVARNVAALGARCLFVGVIGDDEGARAVRAALAAEPSI